MRKAFIAASLLALIGAGTAHAQGTIKIGIILPYSGQFADAATQLDNAHQALHEAARRHGRRQEDRIHPQGYRRHRAGCRQAPRAGTDRARQGRHPRRLRAHAERARGRRRVGRGEEVHGGDERRDLDHHDQVALHGAHLADHCRSSTRRSAPGRTRAASRRSTRWSPTTAPAIDAEGAFQRAFKAAGGEIVGSVRMAVANPDFSAYVQRAKDLNPEGDLHLRSGRRAAGRARQGAGRARHRSAARSR